MITEQQKVDLQWLWLNGWPVSAAAEHLNIAETSASRIIATAKVTLAREGRPWPRPSPVDERPTLPRLQPEPVPQPDEPKPQRQRLQTFEEQLARIAAGARLTRTFKPTRPDHPFTLGGVGSSLL